MTRSGARAPAPGGRGVLALWVLLLGVATTAGAEDFDRDRALQASRAAVGGQVADHVLIDQRGRTVKLASLRDRPAVVSLVYTACYGSCGIVTRRLAQAVDVAREALGRDSFRVLTVSFDAPADTPQRMRAYAREKGIGDDDWLVLTTDPTTAAALAADLGFSYVRSPRGFDHVTQTTVLDASGRVYRQVYGDTFPTPGLVEPLKELVFGTAARASTLNGWINSVKLFCTVYDPAADRYRFDYSVFVAAVTGALCLGGVAVFVVRSWNAGRGPRAS